MTDPTPEEMLAFLLGRFQLHSPKMDGRHSWRFDSTSWPMTFARGSTPEEAIKAAMHEEKMTKGTRSFEERTDGER